MPTNQSQFLNRSLWAAQADTDRAHAEKLKFNDYFAVARTRDVDQAFWQSLLPTHGQHLGAVLVLETRLGALSARLAPYFKTVISWHASFDAAEITRQFVGQQGLDNIRTVVAGHISELDLGSDRLAAVVFYCPSGDLTKQWSTDGTALLRSIVRALPRILADNGVVLIGENNRWSYKLNDANLAGIGRRGSL